MSYIVLMLALIGAGAVWFFAVSREKAETLKLLRKAQAAKRRIFQEQLAVAATQGPQDGRRRKRGFGTRN